MSVHAALGFVRSGDLAVLARAGGAGLDAIGRDLDPARRDRGVGFRLGLEGLQRPERTPEPGLGRAPVAQQDREGASASGIPYQGEAEIVALGVALVLEQLDLHSLGALEAPGGGDDAPRE
jgi:hypothetical protein